MVSFRFAEITFNPVTGELIRQDATVRLRPKSAKLLTLLLESAGTPLDRDTLLDQLWTDRTVTDNTLMQSVREVRAALGDDAASPHFVETLHGLGYRWVGPKAARIEDRPAAGIGSHISPGKSAFTQGPFVLSAIAALMVLAAIVLLGLNSPLLRQLAASDLSRAHDSHLRGQLELSQRYYEAVLLQHPENLEALSRLPVVLYEMGDWTGAVSAAETALEASEADPNWNATSSHLVAGQIASARGQAEVAETHFLAIQSLSRETVSDPAEYAAAISGLSQVYADQGRIADYLSVRADIIELGFSIDSADARAEVLLIAATTIGQTASESSTLLRLERALEEFSNSGNLQGAARAHIALGANRALGAEQRRSHLNAALSYYRQHGHLVGELTVLRAIAGLQTEQLDAEPALQAFARTREIAERIGARRELAAIEYETGLALMVHATRLSEPERTMIIGDAETAFSTAIDQYRTLGVVFDRVAPHLYLAVANFEQGRVEQALDEFASIAARYEALPYPMGIAAARLGEAACLYDLGRDQDAEAALARLSAQVPSVAPLFDLIRQIPARSQANTAASNQSSLFEILITAELYLAEDSPDR